MEAESTQPNVRFSFFPLFFGVVRAPPLPPGAEGPAEPDRIVMLNPISQRMVIFQGGGVDVDSQDALDAVLREVMAMSVMEGGRGPPPASKASILEMKTVEAEECEGECAVCLEEFGRGEELREMPCGHRYHGDCICKWLEINGSCPICRHRMPEEEGVAKKVDEDGDGHGDEESRGGLRGQIWVRIGLGGQSQQEGERRESQEQERSQQNEERAVDD